MEITDLSGYVRNAQGVLMSGECEFSDGKCWKWHRSQGGDLYFSLDSGRPSQWAVENFSRIVTYPKRVAALKKKLADMGELM